MIKLKIKKLQYNINREVAKISALSSGKIEKFEYHTGEKYYHLIKVEESNKLSLHILHSVRNLKSK